MPEFMETTVDKFTFKVATDRYYSEQGIWALRTGKVIRIGLSDYLQQRSGDIAFADVQPAGTQLEAGGDVAEIETIKVDTTVASPVSGSIVTVNPKMELEPEVINQDPYGEGWLCEIEPMNWEADLEKLLEPKAYFIVMKKEAEEEAKNL